MHIKSTLRTLLGELLVKVPTANYRDRVISKQSIKNVILADSELPSDLSSQSQGGLVRILATDQNNAKQIASLITKNKNNLPIRSVHITDKAIEYYVRHKQECIYRHSVIVRLDPKSLLQSATISPLKNPAHLSLLQREVLENVDTSHKTERLVIDFSSPNIAKPFHFGHLKSTILGNYLANINQFLGNQVTKLNYIGDWGTQYGLLSLGLEKFGTIENNIVVQGNGTTPESPLRHLLNIYIQANERAKSDETFYNEAKRRFLAMDKDADFDQLEKWRQIRDLSIEELKRSYSKLGIEFDVFQYESDYAEESACLVERMRSNYFVKRLEDGMMVALVEKNNRILEIPILKSDGASLYITRDVAAAISRKDKFEFDKMLYIVGSDQEKHFHCLSDIVKNLGYDWHDKLIHVKMGKVLGMSSRSGNFVLLSDIIDEATKQYIESTRNTPTTKVNFEHEIEDVGRHLALSALFTFDMRNSRTRNYQFDWDQVMSTSSRSGINLQTTFARLSSLLDRASSAGLQPFESTDKLEPDAICCQEGMNLLSLLDELDNELHSSYWSMDPSPLVNHALRLCQAINRARQSERLWVLGELDERKARTRLSLFKSSHSQLELILKLMGLKPLFRV